MLQLKSKNLSDSCQTYLDGQQSIIDGLPLFADKSLQAGRLWKSKTGPLAGKTAFAEIKNTLILMCIGVEICNYCEQSEASDIEHILPKSLFPSQTFAWVNYLLACKKCNSDHKKDGMYVFNPGGSVNAVWVDRGTEPPTNDYAYIHPRLENPMEWMKLNFNDFLFYAQTSHALGTRGFEKVERTLEILDLNNRPTLVNARTNAFGNYKRLLREYNAVKAAQNHTDLENAVTGDPAVNPQIAFQTEQNRILDALRIVFSQESIRRFGGK